MNVNLYNYPEATFVEGFATEAIAFMFYSNV